MIQAKACFLTIRTRKSHLIGIGILSLFAVALRGYSFGVNDQALYLPFVYHWQNPSLFVHDYLLSLPWALDSILWPALSLLSKWINIRILFLVLYSGATYFSLLFIFQISDVVWKNRTAAWIAVFLWLPPYEIPGSGITTFDSFLTGRCLAMALVLGAVLFFLNDRYEWTWILLMTGIFIHITSVLPAATGILAALVFERRFRETIMGIMHLGCATATMSFIAWVQGAHQDIWTIYSGQRFQLLWHELPDVFPQGWTPAVWMGLVFCGLVLGLVILIDRISGSLTASMRRIFFLAGSAVLLTFLGLAGTYTRMALPAQLCLARSYFWVLLALTLWISGWIASNVLSHNLWYSLLAFYFIATWITGTIQCHILVIAIIVILKLSGLVERKDALPRLAMAVIGILIILQVYWMISLPHHGVNWKAEGLPVGIIFTLTAVSLYRFFAANRLTKLNTTIPYVVGISLALSLLLFPPDPLIAMTGISSPVKSMFPALRAAYARHEAQETNLAFRDRLFKMINQKVPPDSTVIVNPLWIGFRTGTERSSFVTYKDRSGLLYSEAFYREWVRRMHLIRAFRTESGKIDGSLPLSKEELLFMAEEYSSMKLDYIITQRPYNLPIAGKEGPWTLYRLADKKSKQNQKWTTGISNG